MVKQFLSPGFERETLHETYECNSCLQPITNPICHECLGKQMSGWMALYPNIKKKMAPKLKDYVKEVNNNVASGVSCVSCGKNQAALCPYCFAEAIYNLLKKNKIDRMVIMDFLSTFNFDLNHEGYIKEAAEEGLF